MRHQHRIAHRLLAEEETVRLVAHHAVPTAESIHVDRGAPLRRCTFRGVPARRIDLLLPDDFLRGAPASEVAGPVGDALRRSDETWLHQPHSARDPVMVIEIVEKAGRYDGAVRTRIALRPMHSTYQLPAGELMPTVDDRGRLVLTASRYWQDDHDHTQSEVVWSAAYERLRDTLDGYDCGAIVMWHWTRYYMACVRHADAQALAASFVPSAGCGLAEANREASRALYRLARDAGWRKLTLRERARLGLDAQWVDETTYAAARERAGFPSPTGAGQYTLDSAVGVERVVRAHELAYE